MKDIESNYSVSTSGLDDMAERTLRRAMLIENHGTAEAQKTVLVGAILTAFQDPNKWPMTDGERLELLRRIYRMAQCIRETEQA